MTHGKVVDVYNRRGSSVSHAESRQDPPPWIPADSGHTTEGVSDDAQLHMMRAVDTGIINASDKSPWKMWLTKKSIPQLALAVQESAQKLQREKGADALAKGKQPAT